MKIANNLKYTFNKMFDLFINNFKQLYSISLKFSIFASVFSLIVTLIFILTTLTYRNSDVFLNGNFFEIIFLSPFILQKFYLVNISILVLSISLFSIFLLNNNFEENTSLKTFFKVIPKKIYNKYFIYLLLILVVNSIFFGNAIGIDNADFQLTMMFGNSYEYNDKLIEFYAWINSVVDLLKSYFPYFLSMFIIIEFIEENNNFSTIKKYKKAILSALFFSFIVEVVFNSVYTYINYYIIVPLKIPFTYDIIPVTLGYIVLILISAFFFIAFSAILAFPFQYVKNKLKPVDNL